MKSVIETLPVTVAEQLVQVPATPRLGTAGP